MTCPRISYAAFQTVPNQNWRELTHRNKKAQARTESILSSQLQKHTNSLTHSEREREMECYDADDDVLMEMEEGEVQTVHFFAPNPSYFPLQCQSLSLVFGLFSLFTALFGC